MNFVVIRTDHRFQSGEPGLEGLLRGELAKQLIEPFQAVTEEYSNKIGESIGQQLALGRQPQLRWYNVDMTIRGKATGRYTR